MRVSLRLRRGLGRLRDNLWLVPLVFSIGGVLLQRGVVSLDRAGVAEHLLPFSEGTSIQVLAAVITALVSFIGFILTIVTLVIQLTAGQMSFRLLPLWYREPGLKVVLGFFCGTLTYAFTTLGRLRAGFVPGLGTLVAGTLGLISISAFLAFVSGFTRNVAPAGIGARIVRSAHDAVLRVYPHPYKEGTDDVRVEVEEILETTGPSFPVLHRAKVGCVLAEVDALGLVEAASALDCAIVVPHAVGSYVPCGRPLLEVHGARVPPRESALRRLLSVCDEPSFLDDPYFALRLLVDIALRSLAVGDPSTAERMIDFLEDLVFQLSERDLRVIHRDASGRPRLVLVQRPWREYVMLGFAGIADAVWTVDVRALEVAVYLRETLTSLAARVPSGRRGAVEAVLARESLSTVPSHSRQ